MASVQQKQEETLTQPLGSKVEIPAHSSVSTKVDSRCYFGSDVFNSIRLVNVRGILTYSNKWISSLAEPSRTTCSVKVNCYATQREFILQLVWFLA